MQYFFYENIKYLLLLMLLLVFYKNNHNYLYILLFTNDGTSRFKAEPNLVTQKSNIISYIDSFLTYINNL